MLKFIFYIFFVGKINNMLAYLKIINIIWIYFFEGIKLLGV
jgi:hypothetical protein